MTELGLGYLFRRSIVSDSNVAIFTLAAATGSPKLDGSIFKGFLR